MKIKLIILLMLISTGLSYSQIIKGIGIKSGFTLSNQYWEDTKFSYDYNFVTTPGYYEAITIDFISKEYWELSADLGIYQSGSKSEISPFSGFTYETLKDFNFKFGFITLSPVAKFKIPINSFTPYLLVAPRFDYYNADVSNKFANSFQSTIRKPIWGFTVGEGVAYKIKNFSLFAEYQFFYSFNYLMDEPATYPNYYVTRDKVKTNTHVISLGLKYHFTKN